jgi:pimeloyl-ACP methyl ester carboxylesterase
MLHHRIHFHPSADEWVVFLHGAGGSSTIWYKQIRAFKQTHNVLLIDLRGHGLSKIPWSPNEIKRYSFELLAQDVMEVIDELKIERAHFVGISLGCILIRQIAEENPERVQSMILGGAILKMNVRSRFLMWLGNISKNILPYMILYNFFAWIILPKKNHKESRILFVREAKKVQQKEFLRWYKLTANLKGILQLFRNKDLGIPTLYVMGEEDHLFLAAVKDTVANHPSAQLEIFPKCGHVVNVQQPERFNEVSLRFLRSMS